MRSHPLAGSPERARSPCAAGGGGQVPHVPQLQGAGGARQRHQRWGHAAGAPTDLALGPGAAVESRAVGSSLAWWQKSPSVKWGRRTHLRRQSECAGVGAVCLDVLSDSESSAEQGLPPGCPAMRDPPTVAASVLGTAAAAGSRTPGLPGGRASCRAPLSARGTCHESRGPGCVFACLGR